MNRIVLIGNGFDLAHKLPTKYEDFIDWYWDYRVNSFYNNYTNISKDNLCSFEIMEYNSWNMFTFYLPQPIQKSKGKEIIQSIIDNKQGYKVTFSPLFKNICTSIHTKGWVDIENEYYNFLKYYSLNEELTNNIDVLNKQLAYIQELLINYLKEVCKLSIGFNGHIWQEIYSPIQTKDVSIEGSKHLREYVGSMINQGDEFIENKIELYKLNHEEYMSEITLYKNNINTPNYYFQDYPKVFRLPDHVMLLNFNYTHIVSNYIYMGIGYEVHIHGELEKPENVIFGYGDELDANFQKLQNMNNNECLRNIKSIKYLETPNYKSVLSFMEYAPFQVLIMGHSCGNSDRTLLNTIFEHKNCISIKPYYYIKQDGTDNYLDIIQNISRNFTDMKLMRDRVVNKTQCTTLIK